MKKLSKKHKIWLARHASYQAARRVYGRILLGRHNSYRATSVLANGLPVVRLYSNNTKEYVIVRGKAIKSPEILKLDLEHWNSTISFFNLIRSENMRNSSFISRIQIHGMKFPAAFIDTYHDYSGVIYISTTCALVLASEYDRSKILGGGHLAIVDFDKWYHRIAWRLAAIGFFDLAGTERMRNSFFDTGGQKLLRMRRGEDTNGNIIASYLKEIGVDLNEENPILYESLMEAVTNSVQHAYGHSKPDTPPAVRSWWVVAALRIEDGNKRHLVVVIYDQGASIPATIGSWSKIDQLKGAFRRLIRSRDEEPTPGDPRYDGDTIRLAIEVGRTSTHAAYRGKGLSQIVRAIELCESGSVSILSRRGAFFVKTGADPSCDTREIALNGTLIRWDLTL